MKPLKKLIIVSAFFGRGIGRVINQNDIQSHTSSLYLVFSIIPTSWMDGQKVFLQNVPHPCGLIGIK